MAGTMGAGTTGLPERGAGLLPKLLLAAAAVVATLLIWASHAYLTALYSEDLRNRANVRAAIHGGSLVNALERHELVPRVLARDRTLTEALLTREFALTSARLIDINSELRARGLVLMNREGRVVAASDRRLLGVLRADRAEFREAIRSNSTVFTMSAAGDPEIGFHFAHPVIHGGQRMGVIAVQVDFEKLAASWVKDSGRVFVTNAEDVVILSSTPDWRGRLLSPLLEEARVAARRALQLGGIELLPVDWRDKGGEVRIDGASYLRRDVTVGFRGWTLNYLAPLDEVEARVNAVLALELTALALLAALGFWINSKRAWRRFLRLKRESDELRELNRRLSDEIVERRRVEQTLARTEQSLVQASKLAALGQMSAAVSHELNQPLAAMRTYIAGSRLLIERGRTAEAQASIQRIDDLIGRMSALTRQLKAFARKGEDERRPLDLREAVRGALSVVSPHIAQHLVDLVTDVPTSPVAVLGDQLRIEQVLVNLLRNAVDAVRGQEERRIAIVLVPGPFPTIRVTDNGPGLPENPDQVFEPFFTTKKPGEGLGLGLAISAGIARDLGGRLSAWNDPAGGACFELSLPALERVETAAE